MKLVTFELPTPLGPRRRTGAIEGATVFDLSLARAAQLAAKGLPRSREIAAAEVPPDMLDLLRGGEIAIDRARDAVARARTEGWDTIDGATVRHELGQVKLLAPLPRPNSLRDFLVVEEHLRQARVQMDQGEEIPAEWFNLPAHYKGNVDAIYGPEDTVPYPSYTNWLDYELEVCAVIGKAGSRIGASAASSYIAGYTLLNDWSARDFQVRDTSVGIGPGISKDFASSIGPCIATPDEFDCSRSRLEVRVDGTRRASGTLEAMRFSFEEIIEYTTMEATIQPGDLLGSGTIGTGSGIEIGVSLKPGQTVELEAQGIGVLRNRVGEKREGQVRAAWTSEDGNGTSFRPDDERVQAGVPLLD